MLQSLGKTKNGFGVVVDLERSHSATHFAHNPDLFEVVKSLIPSIEVTEDIFRFEKDVGHVVGTSDLVEVTPEDEIVYAKRPLRSTYSKFVKNKQPIPTQWITLDLRKTSADTYSLYTAFEGRLTPSFPGGNYLPEQSKSFWSTHALVWGAQEIVPGTETTECPW